MSRQRLPAWLQLGLALLLAYRIIYHSVYVRDVPFAVATFSDGALYEAAARDILAHPPLGSEPFYLQGLYAYFMAAAMAVWAWPSLALLAQLLIAFLTLWLFFRAAAAAWDKTGGGLATAVLLAYPALAFYENKFLSAELGIACNVLVLVTFAACVREPGGRRGIWLGMATGLSMLARPNMVLAVPFTAWALVQVTRRAGRSGTRQLGALVLGSMLALLPMAARNLIVTGQPTVAPAHGGGTAYYIGNNPHARGVWNDAGGLISGSLHAERSELVEGLGLQEVPRAQRPRRIGRALYGRAAHYIREQPLDWAWLQARKLWLTLGNDELTQDYDWHGEQQLIPWAHRIGVPFGVILGLGVLGLWLVWRGPNRLRPWFWVLGGQTLAVLLANVVFFTSSQHRLPLVIPLAFASGPALWAILDRLPIDMARPAWLERPRMPVWIGVAALVLQSFWARSHKHEPSAVHHFNLAVVQRDIGEPRRALQSLDQALARRPDHPIFLLERAHVLLMLDAPERAAGDLERLAEQPDLPRWVERRARRLQRDVAAAHLGPGPSRQ